MPAGSCLGSVAGRADGRAHAMSAVRPAIACHTRPPSARDPTTRTDLDSFSVLRKTAVAVIAISVIGGAGATPAMAEQSTTSQDAQTSQGIHVATWKMRVTVKARKIQRAPAPTRTRSKAYAFRLVSRRAWPSTQFQCLDSLWTRESNWNHRAYNAGSGAYGIPQALPGSKMGYVAEDWRFNPQTQIRWGLRYIKGRYGSPCGAWGHFQSHNWY
ncbi:hypothetical protein Pmi06nite_07530 [Planotetraspora mira]|uniref:Transglycosylase SLT domain-containing protein n=2 Tax=Planotetraspora mira TaxID=58121 RepID=A0A8J3TKE9_9ACTN|nr:hypothetical protein Pmi06nite_07530 [Planotetraspora mira]